MDCRNLHSVPVRLADRSYEVHIGRDLLSSLGSLAKPLTLGKKCAVITDSVVAPLYSEQTMASLLDAGFDPLLLTVPSGEKSKSFTVAEDLCQRMAVAGLDRKAFVVALGGGVVGDLAGFVAAIYFRGIPFVQVPTTVLAQVDSSVGGKTGINLAAGKNLVGAFHQPRLVVADTTTLDTLPAREFNEGFAEIIKHAVIRDADLFERLKSFDRGDLGAIIRRNVEIKAAVVAADEREETGIRALLNFGHTIGHGIENAAGYGVLLHGEAISLGIVAAARLSVKKAGLSETEAAEIIALLEKFSLPTRLPDDISTAAVVAALQKDKKFDEGAIRFVLSPRIREAFVSKDITPADIQHEIDALRK